MIWVTLYNIWQFHSCRIYCFLTKISWNQLVNFVKIPEISKELISRNVFSRIFRFYTLFVILLYLLENAFLSWNWFTHFRNFRQNDAWSLRVKVESRTITQQWETSCISLHSVEIWEVYFHSFFHKSYVKSTQLGPNCFHEIFNRENITLIPHCVLDTILYLVILQLKQFSVLPTLTEMLSRWGKFTIFLPFRFYAILECLKLQFCQF